MSASAWVFMIAAWGVIIGCTLYCFFRMLTSPRALGMDEPSPSEPAPPPGPSHPEGIKPAGPAGFTPHGPDRIMPGDR